MVSFSFANEANEGLSLNILIHTVAGAGSWSNKNCHIPILLNFRVIYTGISRNLILPNNIHRDTKHIHKSFSWCIAIVNPSHKTMQVPTPSCWFCWRSEVIFRVAYLLNVFHHVGSTRLFSTKIF